MVAIILSVYKKDNVLPVYLAVQSLLHQTYREISIFIRIDGEVNQKVESLLSYFQRNNSNIYISRNDSNRGLSYSLNKLIDIILVQDYAIKYIARMDSDDICHLDRIKQQVEFLNKNKNVDVLGTACKEFGIFNKVITKDKNDASIKKNILKMSPFIHPSVMFRAKVFFDGNRYPLDTVLSEDLSFWLTLSLKNYCFHNLTNILLFYRINDSTLVRRTGLKKSFSELKIRCDYLRKTKKNVPLNLLFILGHFGIRIMPISIVRLIYRLMR